MIKKSATIPLQYDTGFSPFSAAEFNSGLLWVKANGFDGVELVISEPGKVDVNALKSKLESLNLEVSTIATGQSTVLEGISLTDPSREIREKAVERIKEHIDLSIMIGHPNVTIGLIRGKNGPVTQEQPGLLIFELGKCIEYAKDKKVILNLEPINRYETGMLNSCEDTLRFLNKIGNPENVGILYDTFHSNIEDADMLGTIKKLKGKISHVHFADSNRHLPGEGHIDFKSIYAMLERNGYEGYISLETLNLPDCATIKQNAGRCMRDIFGKGE